MRFLLFPIITNIYMEYFEEMALGLECPIPTPWWMRYVNDVISLVKKNQVYCIESPITDGSIPFLNTKCPQQRSLHPNLSQQKTNPHRLVFQLEFQPYYYQLKSVVHALI